MIYRAILVIALILGLATAATAQQPSVFCDLRPNIVQILEEKYEEYQIGMGLSSPVHMTEVWANLTTGTWTILVTQPNGASCVVATGEGWQQGTGRSSGGMRH
jgi:hypothetical protein